MRNHSALLASIDASLREILALLRVQYGNHVKVPAPDVSQQHHGYCSCFRFVPSANSDNCAVCGLMEKPESAP
jgi:rRNA maturation endonuclease Nob1